MHGVRREDFYKTPEEERAFSEKLEKGFKLLDSFVGHVRSSELTVSSADGLLGDAAEADRMFELSRAIIDFMPEFYPSWNYRKNYVLQSRLCTERALELLRDELSISEDVLKVAPKCYAVWHHRLWTLTVLHGMRCSDLADILRNELKLCMLFFRLDGRNFHGWGHLNFVKHYLGQLEAPPESGAARAVDRLCFAEFDKLIEKNFSNYSAWYNRACLSETCGTAAGDIERLTHAIYTDPNDQCLWHYFDWLLYRRNAVPHFLVHCQFFRDPPSLVFHFNECVSVSATDSFVTVYAEDGHVEHLAGSWEPAVYSTNPKLQSASLPHYMWRFVCREGLDLHAGSRVVLKLMLESDVLEIDSYYSHLQRLPRCIREEGVVPPPAAAEPCLLALGYELGVAAGGELHIDLDSMECMRSSMLDEDGWQDLSEVLRLPVRLPGSGRIVSVGKDITTEVFQQQLDMITTLLDMGTESKYLHLARHKIKRYVGQPSSASKCYAQVIRIDPLRSAMYSDLLLVDRAQSALASTVASCVAGGSGRAELRSMGLVSLGYRTMVPHVRFTELDLAGNALSESSLVDFGVCALLALRRLSLARNKFTRLNKLLEALQWLPRLERIDVSGNPLCVPQDSVACALPPSLQEVEVTDTPLAEALAPADGTTAALTGAYGLHVHVEESSTGEGARTAPGCGATPASRVYLRRLPAGAA